jgi:uncharacterized membrane protein YedE/YeeE
MLQAPTQDHGIADMDNFTPYAALAGGVLIGISASRLLWLNGRIAGISSITSGLLQFSRGDMLWRVVFLAGLVLGAGAWYAMAGGAPAGRETFPALLLLAGGALVGYGTSLGGGCTSGHGVCGLGRLSLRSLVATLVFLVTGIATTFVVRHVFGVY